MRNLLDWESMAARYAMLVRSMQVSYKLYVYVRMQTRLKTPVSQNSTNLRPHQTNSSNNAAPTPPSNPSLPLLPSPHNRPLQQHLANPTNLANPTHPTLRPHCYSYHPLRLLPHRTPIKIPIIVFNNLTLIGSSVSYNLGY